MNNDTESIARQAHADRLVYFRSMHEARLLDGRSAVQTALLINGAAASAMLAFLGSMSASSTPHHLPRAFVWALCFFGAGVFLAAWMAVMAYAANHRYAESIGAMRSTWQLPFIEPNEPARRHDLWARRFHAAAYGLAAGTLSTFLAGISAAAIGFVHLH